MQISPKSLTLEPRLFFLGFQNQLRWFVASFFRQVQSRLSIPICGIDVGSFLDQKTKSECKMESHSKSN